MASIAIHAAGNISYCDNLILINIMIAFQIFLIIVIIGVVATWRTAEFEDYMFGYWSADNDSFTEQAEIDSMLLFIGAPSGRWKRTRECYLVILSDVCDQALTLCWRPSLAGPSATEYCVNATAVFDEENPWEENVKITVDMTRGMLTVSANDKIYARLHKNMAVSDAARDLIDVKIVD